VCRAEQTTRPTFNRTDSAGNRWIRKCSAVNTVHCSRLQARLVKRLPAPLAKLLSLPQFAPTPIGLVAGPAHTPTVICADEPAALWRPSAMFAHAVANRVLPAACEMRSFGVSHEHWLLADRRLPVEAGCGVASYCVGSSACPGTSRQSVGPDRFDQSPERVRQPLLTALHTAASATSVTAAIGPGDAP
jgi:hypothetical protein